jgi:hypothetical protein
LDLWRIRNPVLHHRTAAKDNGGGFILPASQIVPTFEENRAAAFDLIERWLTPAHAIAAE